MLQQRSSPCYM